MDIKNQEFIYCEVVENIEFIAIIVINFVLKEFLKIILNHKLTIIICIKKNN